MLLGYICGCVDQGRDIGAGAMSEATQPDWDSRKAEAEELLKTKAPDGKVWIAYETVASSGLARAIVSSHYRVCDSDLWQPNVDRQEEVLATLESATILDIDIGKGVFKRSHSNITSSPSNGSMWIEAKAWCQDLGGASSSVWVLSQADAGWGVSSAPLSQAHAKAGVILKVRPDEAGEGCWLLYWVSMHVSHTKEEANDNVGGGVCTPDVYIDGNTEVSVGECPG
jgi:hypothetical protein